MTRSQLLNPQLLIFSTLNFSTPHAPHTHKFFSHALPKLRPNGSPRIGALWPLQLQTARVPKPFSGAGAHYPALLELCPAQPFGCRALLVLQRQSGRPGWQTAQRPVDSFHANCCKT